MEPIKLKQYKLEWKEPVAHDTLTVVSSCLLPAPDCYTAQEMFQTLLENCIGYEWEAGLWDVQGQLGGRVWNDENGYTWRVLEYMPNGTLTPAL